MRTQDRMRGARAVQVVAALGDSVVQVAHLEAGRRGRPASSFRLGRGEGADFASADAPAEGLALVRDRGGRMVVTIAPGMGGAQVLGGAARSVAELAARGEATPSAACAGGWELPVPDDGFIRADCGKVRFFVSATERPRRRVGLPVGAFDRRAGAYLLGSALAHLALILLLRTIPPEPSSLALGLIARVDRVASIDDLAREQGRVGPDEGSGEARAASPGDPGAAGDPDSAARDRAYASSRRADEYQLSRADATRRARTAGFLGVLQHGGDVFSLAHFAPGDRDVDADGALWGGEYGRSHGHFGTGLWGRGPGGDGAAWGLIGSGRYCPGSAAGGCGLGPDGAGSIGLGMSGIGSCGGGAPPEVRPCRGRESAVPKVVITISPPLCSPECIDRAIIRRYIRRTLPQIQHCYERALITRSELEGTVSTTFLVNGTGSVLGAQASGIGDEALESCVASVVETIQFPRSPDGRSFQVVYPFSFRKADG